MLILTRFILGFLPALRMPGWVPISYSSLISKTFVCSSLLLPTKKKMCLHTFPGKRAPAHGPLVFSDSPGTTRWDTERDLLWSFCCSLLSFGPKPLPQSLALNIQSQSTVGAWQETPPFSFQFWTSQTLRFLVRMLNGKVLLAPTKKWQIRDDG